MPPFRDMAQDFCLALSSKSTGDGYHITRLVLPKISQLAHPGDFLQIANDVLPIMRVNDQSNWLEIFSADLKKNWTTNSTTPLHATLLSTNRFFINKNCHTPLLIGQDLGMAVILFLAETLKKQHKITPIVLLELNKGLPFRPQPSKILMPSLPSDIIATMPILEDWSIPCRIAHNNGLPGCFDGDVIELAEYWLEKQQVFEEIYLYGCGKKEMLKSISKLAQKFSVPCQTIKIT